MGGECFEHGGGCYPAVLSPSRYVGSIYDQIGGTAAVGAAVEDLYRRLLGDPELAGYFEDIDMGRLKRHMRAFLTMALGGERLYHGRDMREAHAGIGVTGEAFDRMAGHLAAALRGLGVGQEQAATILARVALLRGEVIGA
jgi:hemoglobin